MTTSMTALGYRVAAVVAATLVFAAHAGDDPLHPVDVRNPPGLGTVDAGLRDVSGAVVGIACATCHAPNDDGALARKGDPRKDFHGGIDLVHGDLSCQSCHDPIDRTRLRLANGKTLPFDDVIRLCGQCHGPQRTAFWKGVHGGARGYWDRSKGPQIRNSCVSCHRAHAPALPTVVPAPPPNDRFLSIPNPVKGSDHE